MIQPTSLLLPREQKQRHKLENVEGLKVAHDKFSWSGKEIPHVGRYGGHKWQRYLA